MYTTLCIITRLIFINSLSGVGWGDVSTRKYKLSVR